MYKLQEIQGGERTWAGLARTEQARRRRAQGEAALTKAQPCVCGDMHGCRRAVCRAVGSTGKAQVIPAATPGKGVGSCRKHSTTISLLRQGVRQQGKKFQIHSWQLRVKQTEQNFTGKQTRWDCITGVCVEEFRLLENKGMSKKKILRIIFQKQKQAMGWG